MHCSACTVSTDTQSVLEITRTICILISLYDGSRVAHGLALAGAEPYWCAFYTKHWERVVAAR